MKKEKIFNIILIGMVALFVLSFVVLPFVSQSSHWYVVTSGSMEPTLHVGDVVYVSNADAQDINVGDIINFHQEGATTTVTHRCINITTENNTTFFTTKGDANEDNDTLLISENELIGKVPYKKLFGYILYVKAPRLGYLSNFVHTTLGFLLLVMVPGYTLIGMEAYNIFNTIQELPYKKNGYTLYRSERGHYFFAKKSNKGEPIPLPDKYKVIISQRTGFPFLKRANGEGELEMTICLRCKGIFYYKKINGANEVNCVFCGERWTEIVKG